MALNERYRWVYLRFFIICVTIFLFTNCFAITKASSIPPGKYFEINHSRIYAVSIGKGPYVIFESGLGDDPSTWKKVAPAIAKQAHVILYDRAGTGKSSLDMNNKNARTAQDVVNNLRSLLEQLHAKPPYILVGHSLGGLYMQLFAREYPKEVSGVVLVDSASFNQSLHDPLPNKNSSYYLEALGVTASEKEVKKAASFPDVPLIVLSATIHGPANSIYNTKENKEEWANLQKQLATMSKRSEHITANNTGHYIQKEKPWLVIAAIKEIIEMSKK